MNNKPYVSNIVYYSFFVPNKKESCGDYDIILCETIYDKDGKQLPPLSAGSDKVNIELIFKMFEQFPMHQV